MATMPSTVAATSTLAMVRTMESRGFETEDLLAAVGLSPGVIEDPDARIPGPTVLALWNTLRQRSGDPALQLVAPTILPFGAYRVIDYLVAASATVGDGLERFIRFFGLIADGVQLTIEADGDERRLRLEGPDGAAVPALYVDYVFAALVGRIRLHIRPELRLRAVRLRQPAPVDPGPYEEIFHAPIRFHAPLDCLCFDRDELNAPTQNADEVLARLLEEHARMLAERLPQQAASFLGDVHRALAAALPENAAATTVARSLHISVRTLQRRLSDAGTTFRRQCDSVRRGLAEAYLADPGVSICEVAFLLGFSDQTAFNRAFRRWTGMSPGSWRRLGAGAGRVHDPRSRAPHVASLLRPRQRS